MTSSPVLGSNPAEPATSSALITGRPAVITVVVVLIAAFMDLVDVTIVAVGTV